MSKMSQLNLALTEEANDMGYISLDQALADGWEIDYERGKLYKGVNALELAHKEYLKRKEVVLNDLESLCQSFIEGGHKDEQERIKRIIDFVREGEK